MSYDNIEQPWGVDGPASSIRGPGFHCSHLTRPEPAAGQLPPDQSPSLHVEHVTWTQPAPVITSLEPARPTRITRIIRVFPARPNCLLHHCSLQRSFLDPTCSSAPNPLPSREIEGAKMLVPHTVIKNQQYWYVRVYSSMYQCIPVWPSTDHFVYVHVLDV